LRRISDFFHPFSSQFLEYLTQQTKALVPNGMIIWYDSVIKSGELKWQNELNDANQVFFESCDGIFLNYNWRDEHLVRSKEIIQKSYPNRQHDVFVGIDVFGRGQVAKWQSHETLAQIRNHDLSVAIFAPGWTWESLHEKVSLFEECGTDDCNSSFLENNDTFWRLLWPHLPTNAVTHLPFRTTFCLGSGKFQNCGGQCDEARPWFNLTKQSHQMSVPIGASGVSRCFEDSFNGGCCLKLTYNEGAQQRLFVCDFDCSQGLLVTLAVKCENEAVDVDLILHVVDKKLDQRRKIVCLKNPRTADGAAVHLPPLDRNQLETLNLKSSVNGWEMRHFFLAFAVKFDYRLCDIGVRVVKTGEVPSTVRLGVIAVEQRDVSSLDLIKITI
jgi:mannosyl-glycoprotein endo-beta-N-acetylglucosaminidase